MYRFPLPLGTTHFRLFSAGLGLISLALVTTSCSAKPDPRPAVEVRTVTVTKEIQRPCAVATPNRPTPLAKPYPTDPVALAATLARKLLEWSGPGGYGDRAADALAICTAP